MIILVTGLMRTGTSLASWWLHEMGVPMGITMRFPFSNPKGQVDWEDIEFTDYMLEAVKGKHGPMARRQFMRRYINKRSAPLWGVKSPFLLPFVEEFKAVVDNDEVRVVLTTRDIDQTYESLTDQGVLNESIEVQKLLIPALSNVNPDLVIEINESWESPETVKDKLLNLIRS